MDPQCVKFQGVDNSVSQSFALVMNVPDVSGGKGFVHWIKLGTWDLGFNAAE